MTITPWPSQTPAGTRARTAVARAIRRGELTRQPCVKCGNEKSEGHHEDYGKPLEVVWLCRLHHSWVHKYGESPFREEDAA